MYAVKSGVTIATPYMVLQLFRMCQGGLHAVLRSHIGIFILSSLRTSQYRVSFIPLSVSLWNDLADPVFDYVGLAGFKSRANAFSKLLYSFFIPFFRFSSSCWYCGAGVFGLIGCTSLSPSLALPTSFTNNNNFTDL